MSLMDFNLPFETYDNRLIKITDMKGSRSPKFSITKL